MDSLKDASELGRDLVAGKNAAIEDVDGKKALKLNGGESFASVKDDALTTVGLGNDLRVKVKRTSASVDPQVLFESDYGSIMAVQEGTGKVGFTRENRAYSFNYTLPVNEWVELEIKNKFEQASLYVNGTLVDTLGDGETVEGKPLKAPSCFPFSALDRPFAHSRATWTMSASPPPVSLPPPWSSTTLSSPPSPSSLGRTSPVCVSSWTRLTPCS